MMFFGRHVCVTMLSACTAVATAQPVLVEDQALFATQPELDDWFGWSVDVSGNLAVVGMPKDDEVATDAGAVYVFDVTTGQLLHQLAADNGEVEDEFGFSVAIDGTTVVVGAWRPQITDGTVQVGTAYVFDAVTGQQLHELTPDDGAIGDWFGWSVDVSGTMAVVGAPNNNDFGAAYVFDTVTGQQIWKLVPSDGEANEDFASSVAISSDHVIVGLTGDRENGAFSGLGAVYVYDTHTGGQIDKLLPSDTLLTRAFGSSVAMSGATAVIGAQATNDPQTLAGAVYVFDVRSGFELMRVVNPAPFFAPPADDRFGVSVDISGQIAVVGANQSTLSFMGGNSGAAYLIDLNTGETTAWIYPADTSETSFERFGESVAISGTTVIAGQAFGEGANPDNSGSAYLFTAPTPACPADLTGDDTLNNTDVNVFVNAFLWRESVADINGDGSWNNTDINLFVQSFLAGCG